MELNDYQKRAMSTCTRTSNNFSYMFLNLVGEVGEFASKVAKHIRKEEITIGDYAPNEHDWYFKGDNGEPLPVQEWEKELQKEAGDILWQLSGLCTIFGWTLEDVAQMNLDKLASRAKNGTIVGNGDGVTAEERCATK